MLMWEGKMDLSWVDWKRVKGLYKYEGAKSWFVVDYNKYFDSILTQGDFHEDYPSITMRLENIFRIPFEDLPKHLGGEPIIIAVVLYRLEIGK